MLSSNIQYLSVHLSMLISITLDILFDRRNAPLKSLSDICIHTIQFHVAARVRLFYPPNAQ